MATTVYDVCVNQLRQRRRELEEALGTASAKDYADYREICGFIRGLITAESYLTDLVRKQEYSDDE